MAHQKSTKSRPAPLKDLQIAVQTGQSRRYLILDTDSPLPSPAYPFAPCDNPARSDHICTPCCSLQVTVSAPPHSQVEPYLDAYRWDDPCHGAVDQCYRSFTPPLSPPVLSPHGQDIEYSSKRSGRTFALVPAQVNGKHVFTHAVVNPQDDDSKQEILSRKDGLPEDMQDILRQLDDLACWVKAASSSRDCHAASSVAHVARLAGYAEADPCNPSAELYLDKGKNRLQSASLPSDYDIRRDYLDYSGGAMPSDPPKVSALTNYQAEGFIYTPNCNAPEFLVGSSSSPVAYPVSGYSSHPARYSPRFPEKKHEIPSHRRFLERRSAPCPPPISPLVSPPMGKTSFKTLFQRSRCNTAVVTCPSIPPGHVPVESALRQGKRIRLPWLRM